MMTHHLFVESSVFTRLVDDYLNDDEYGALQQYLVEHPTAGSVIRNSGGVRKLRWSLRGTGKRGGLRVIYALSRDSSIWMLTIYRKGEVDSIAGPVLRQIKEMMDDE